jgi:hypothetical protein
MADNKIQNETLNSNDVSGDVLTAIQRLMELNEDYNINNDTRRGRGK